ncbi:MAG TPA: formate dehydrogenase, partial [Geminicoccaceae bacterium]|nr:formate dehydrogenase [Geminicoccaceae bacterium]
GEKDGTYTNLHRLVQWHDKVVEAPDDSRSESWFVYHLGRRLKQLYAHSREPKDAPILNLTWDYPTSGEREEPSVDAVLKEINGYSWPERRQLKSYKDSRPTARPLAAAGPTAASIRRKTTTGPARAGRTGLTDPGPTSAGRSAGPPTGAPWSTAPRPIPPAGPGRSARS